MGMEAYATTGERCPGRAKSSPEDFRVEELVSGIAAAKEPLPGYLPLYRVEKRGIDTMHMAEEISDVLKSRVSYGGLKDSVATASQYVTPTSVKSERPERISREKFSAELVGYVPKPLTRGSVVGNRFEIVLRDCCDEIGARAEEALDAARRRRVPNYFGLQRFGAGGAGTHVVGKALVKRDFEGAVKLLMGAGEGRRHPSPEDAERSVARELDRHPGEWIRAMRAVSVRLRRLYVQAYQSYIFNKTLSLSLSGGEDVSEYQEGDNWAVPSEDWLTTSYPKSARERPAGRAVPLVQLAGFAYRNYGSRFDRYVELVMESEGVSPREFFVDEMQEVSAEGGFRRPHIAMVDGSVDIAGQTATLRFALAKGQYATVLLREIMKPEDPLGSGLA
ncbi:MAG: tRNA pseudouridine(13) synthase TruD [Nitrososphaerota archaeon]|nr:tRNA pseudouridine(13) synthase TruD [Nitrososphaerota archaeon]